MRDVYIENYATGMMLRVSLDLLWHYVSWPPEKDRALTMTKWGPFYLTSNNAPYLTMFIRAADRTLYHAINAWRNLAADLYIINQISRELKADERMQTSDRGTKYEIEAFLGSIVAITENNLIGLDTKNRLGGSQALGKTLINQLNVMATSFHALGFESKWRAVRNSAYHLGKEMTDWGASAEIRKNGECHIVTLEGIHYVEGAPTDLVDLLTESFSAFVQYVTAVRDLLTQFAFQNIAYPSNNTYKSVSDPLGNMIVGLGRDGYELRHFPQTASDFIGPLKS